MPYGSYDPDEALRRLYGEIPRYQWEDIDQTNPLSPLTNQQYSRYIEAEKPSTVGSVLTFLNDNLDKLARPVRALAGKLIGSDKASWRELGAFLPFSDQWLTDPKETITTSDLRRGLGIQDTDENSPWYKKLGQGVLDHLIIESLTNPLTLAVFGGGGVRSAGNALRATGQAGQVGGKVYGTTTRGVGALTQDAQLLARHGGLPMSSAERFAGLKALPDEIVLPVWESIGKKGMIGESSQFADILTRLAAKETVPMQGALKLPFMAEPIGASPGLERIVAQLATFPFGGVPGVSGRTADWIMDKGRYLPLVKEARSFFSGSVSGSRDPFMQQAKEHLFQPIQKEMVQEYVTPFYKNNMRLAGAGVDATDDAVRRYLTEAAEGLSPTPPASITASQQGAIGTTLDNLRAMNEKARADIIAKGGKVDETTKIPYWPRYATGPKSAPPPGDAFHALFGDVGDAVGRRDLPGIYRATIDDVYAARNTINSPQDILNNFGTPTLGTRGVSNPSQAGMLFESITRTPKNQPLHGLYGNPMQDELDYLVKAAEKNATYETAHRALALQAQPIGPGMLSIPQAIKKLDMDQGTALSYFAETMGKLGTPLTSADLPAWGVPIEAVASLKTGKSFAEKTVFGKAFDAVNNIFKTYVTQLFPAYHTANLVGGWTQNLMTGTYDPTVSGLKSLLKPYIDATAALRRKPIQGIEQFAERFGLPLGSNSAQVTDAMLAEMMSRGVLSPQSFLSAETVGPMGRSFVQVPMSPGQAGFFKGTAPTSWNPLATRGVWSEETAGAKLLDRIGEAGHSEFLPIRKAEQLSSVTDSWNRAAHFIAKIKQGLTPDQAAASTLAAHFDYSALSPFEKSTIRRLVPFYSWQRGNMMLMANTLASHPGKINTMIGVNQIGSDQGYTPQNLRGNLNIGIGAPEEYTHPESGRKELRQTFMRLLPQLPFEEAMKWLTLKPGEGLSRLGPLAALEEKIGGATTPIGLRPLLERLRGQSYLTDQRVDARQLMPDMSPWWKTAMETTPLGRPNAMFRGAERELKADRPIAEVISTFLGGPQFRTMDLVGAREREARDVLQSRLPSVAQEIGGRYNVPLELRDRLQPEDIIRMRALRTLEGLQQERSMSQRLERLLEPGSVLDSFMAPSRAGLEEFAPLWRNALAQDRSRRQWRDLGMGGRDPYASLLSRDRRDILSRLVGQ